MCLSSITDCCHLDPLLLTITNSCVHTLYSCSKHNLMATLTAATVSNIEVQICGDEDTVSEDTSLELIEICVK